MAEQVYKLNPTGPLHVGTWGIGREQTLTYVPSDTLFSALVVAWAMLEGSGMPVGLRGFLEDSAEPPFLLSSAFPFAGPVRFFPRPQLYLELPRDLRKRIKNTSWVSEDIFNALRRRQFPTEHLDQSKNFVQNGTVWLTLAEREQISTALDFADAPEDPNISLTLWSLKTVPRVTIDRNSNASNLFHSGRLNFTPGCGLWFAARGDDLSRLEVGLNYLEDTGLGGLRGTGHGAFDCETWSDVSPLPEPDTDEHFVTLSRFAPKEQELDSILRVEQAGYQLVTVAGWCQDDVGHPWRRKRVRLIAEGAYLGWPGHVPGQVVDVTPDGVGQFTNGRRVLRYGLAFAVGTS